MSYCDTNPTATSLNYCGTGEALIHVGTLPTPREESGLLVMLTNLANGRIEVCELVGDDLETVTIDHPAGLAPSTFYEIKIVGVTDTTGIHPIPFYPYEFDGSEFIVSPYSTVQGVVVRFNKLFNGAAVHSHTEQFITLE